MIKIGRVWAEPDRGKIELLFGKILNPLWQTFYDIGQIFDVVHGQIKKDILFGQAVGGSLR